METRSNTETAGWRPQHAYIMAAVCLMIGLALGYLFRGSQSPAAAKADTSQPQHSAAQPSQPMPTLADMKRMADKQAEPLLTKLKDYPKDTDLLMQLGTIYSATHQFPEAVGYYQRALQIDPQSVNARTRMANCLYYEGKIDEAIAELNQSLKYNPKHAGTLFNLGMIKWRGKGDGAGAAEAWQRLLDLYQTMPSDLPNRDTVTKLVAEARQHPAMK